MRTVTALVLSSAMALSTCTAGADDTPTGPAVAVTVAPLSLAGITDASWRITVRNAAIATVFSVDVTSSGYGPGDGSLAYVGPCDADANENTVTLELLSLREGPAGASLVPVERYHNPGPMTRAFTCRANADVAVDFDVTVARSANQGFFDVAVSFSDIFCSAKLDCVDADGAPIKLLHAPAGERSTTVVVALACTQGEAGQTVLYHTDVEVDCAGTGTAVVDPSMGPGNLSEGAGITGSAGVLFGAAVHRGRESFTLETGYWNVLLGLVDGVPDCVVTTTASAAAGPLVAPTTPADTVYPYISWQVTVTDATGALMCTRHPLDGLPPNDGVVTLYTAADGERPMQHAYAVASGALISDRCPADPLKVAPGACGCATPDTDSDSDTAPDCIDGCPADPLKVAPGACGCGTPDTDSDSDTAPDCIDGCPADPLKVAPGACGCATPDTDSDSDTTPDCIDGCPADPLKVAPGTCGCGVPEGCSTGWVDVAAVGDGHANLARIDDSYLAVAYTDLPVRTTAPVAFNVRIAQLVGGTLVLGAPVSFSANLIAATSDQAIQIAGPIGAPYFLVHTVLNDYTDAFHLMKRVGTSAERVYTLNWPTATTAAFWAGHPLDDTRFIVRYREGNSDQPVKYRVIVRSGETLSLSATPFTRPAPTAFPGLGSSEPQTHGPLVRTGATTFRELRGGYVWLPGSLSSWTLTVNAANTMASSNIQVHSNSSTRTMGPLGVGNGSGTAIVAYASYDDANHQFGNFSTGTSAYTHQGVLHTGGASYAGQSGDSTAGHLGGKYFLRGRNGSLYRFASLGAAPTVMESGLTWNYCGYAPSIARLGSYGVFLVCGPGGLRLRYLLLE